MKSTGQIIRLTLFTFEESIRRAKKDSKDEALAEFINATRKPAFDGKVADKVGKVYGLAAMMGEGGLASEGMVGTIETVVNLKGKGSAKVTGSEVAKSLQASAEQGRICLNNELEWKFELADFYIELVTPMKGMDVVTGHPAPLSGPSAGAAIALSMLSAALNIPVRSDTVITGGITEHGEIIPVGGLDYRGTGKFMAALETEGIKQIIIPRSNFIKLQIGDLNYFERVGLEVHAADTIWDVIEMACGVSKDKILSSLGMKDMSEI